MTQTETLVVGASISGLASAACLQKRGVGYIVIEKQTAVAAPGAAITTVFIFTPTKEYQIYPTKNIIARYHATLPAYR